MNLLHTRSATVVEVSALDIIRLLAGRTLKVPGTGIAVRMGADRTETVRPQSWQCWQPRAA